MLYRSFCCLRTPAYSSKPLNIYPPSIGHDIAEAINAAQTPVEQPSDVSVQDSLQEEALTMEQMLLLFSTFPISRCVICTQWDRKALSQWKLFPGRWNRALKCAEGQALFRSQPGSTNFSPRDHLYLVAAKYSQNNCLKSAWEDYKRILEAYKWTVEEFQAAHEDAAMLVDNAPELNDAEALQDQTIEMTELEMADNRSRSTTARTERLRRIFRPRASSAHARELELLFPGLQINNADYERYREAVYRSKEIYLRSSQDGWLSFRMPNYDSTNQLNFVRRTFVLAKLCVDSAEGPTYYCDCEYFGDLINDFDEKCYHCRLLEEMVSSLSRLLQSLILKLKTDYDNR